MMWLVLMTLVGNPLVKETHPSVLWKWAKLLSIGAPAIDLAQFPAELKKRQKTELWSDDDTNPSYRSKHRGSNMSKRQMLSMPTDVIGVVSPTANKLIPWSAGPAKGAVLPAKEEADVDQNAWFVFEKRVCLMKQH